MNASNEIPHESPAWNDCPPGEIENLVGRLRGRRRRRRLLVGGLSGVVAMLAIAVGMAVMNRSPDAPEGEGILAGGIWCSDLMEWSDEYLTEQLDAARTRQVEAHLAGCEHCQQKMLEMRESAPPPVPTEVHVPNHGRGQPVSLASR